MGFFPYLKIKMINTTQFSKVVYPYEQKHKQSVLNILCKPEGEK